MTGCSKYPRLLPERGKHLLPVSPDRGPCLRDVPGGTIHQMHQHGAVDPYRGMDRHRGAKTLL